jgi:regulator of protease activity HflC (stomatin/prohibitin superfamily)
MEALLSWLSNVWESLTPWVIIDPWEKGIRVRLGRWIKDVGPGVHICLPFIDSVEALNVLPQRIVLPNQSLRTGDGKVIALSGALLYGVRDARKVWMEVENHDESLVTLAMNHIAEYVSSVPSEDITVESLQKYVLPKIRRQGLRWGLDVTDIGIKDLAPHRVFRFMSDEGANLGAMFGV